MDTNCLVGAMRTFVTRQVPCKGKINVGRSMYVITYNIFIVPKSVNVAAEQSFKMKLGQKESKQLKRGVVGSMSSSATTEDDVLLTPIDGGNGEDGGVALLSTALDSVAYD